MLLNDLLRAVRECPECFIWVLPLGLVLLGLVRSQVRARQRAAASDRRGCLVVEITLAGESPGPEESALAQRIEGMIAERGIGAVTDRDSGEGVLDLFIDTPDVTSAKAELSAVLRELRVGDRAEVQDL